MIGTFVETHNKSLNHHTSTKLHIGQRRQGAGIQIFSFISRHFLFFHSFFYNELHESNEAKASYESPIPVAEIVEAP